MTVTMETVRIAKSRPRKNQLERVFVARPTLRLPCLRRKLEIVTLQFNKPLVLNDFRHCVVKRIYGLLTKCEVKMAGYIGFFACLWTETESRSINTQKKNEANIKPS